MTGWMKAILMLAAVVVIVVGGFIAFFVGQEIWRNLFGHRYAEQVVNIDEDDPTIVQSLYLSGAQRVNKGPIVRKTLSVDQNFDVASKFGSGPKSSYQNALNVLFLEAGKPDRWLFPANAQLIVDMRAISLVPLGQVPDNQPDIALMMILVTADTNADKRLSENDAMSLVLVQPDGRGMVTLVEGLNGRVDVLPDPKNIVLSIEGDAGLEILRVEPTDFAVTESRKIDFPK